MKVGSRVLVRGAQQLYSLGIVTAMDGPTATVLLDKGTTQTSKVDRLVQILFFDKFVTAKIDSVWFRQHEKLIQPEDFDIRTFFLSKKAQLCTIPLLTAMFYWANTYIFESKIGLPKIGTNTKRQGASGIYMPKDDYLAVSKKSNVTPREIFTTMVHEMVHVYQYKVTRASGGFDPKAGYHGKTFMKWAGPIKEIAGVPLTVLHDMSTIEVDEAEHEETKKAGMFVILSRISGRDKDWYFAGKNEKKENVDEARKALRSEHGIMAKYYTRTLSNAALLNLITNVKNARGMQVKKVAGYCFSPLPESVFDSIMKIAKPLEE